MVAIGVAVELPVPQLLLFSVLAVLLLLQRLLMMLRLLRCRALAVDWRLYRQRVKVLLLGQKLSEVAAAVVLASSFR